MVAERLAITARPSTPPATPSTPLLLCACRQDGRSSTPPGTPPPTLPPCARWLRVPMQEVSESDDEESKEDGVVDRDYIKLRAAKIGAKFAGHRRL